MKILLALLFCSTILADSPYSLSPVKSTVPVRASVSEVETAIKQATIRIGWIPKVESDNLIEAKLIVRTHELVVDISFTETEYTIEYKSSKNLKYNEKRQTIHRKYRQWVRTLDLNIQKELVRQANLGLQPDARSRAENL